MKKIVFLIASALFIAFGASATTVVSVQNSLAVERTNEMAEISLKELGLNPSSSFVILDNNGEEIPYQILKNGTLIFPVKEIAASSSLVFTVKEGTPSQVIANTFARFVPERKDDFAWENDRVAFRMYGPALKPEDPSNGVDFWLKRTEKLIIDQFYNDDLTHNKSYHIDHGEGLDCYKVAHTLGAGGVAPYVDSVLWVGGPYSRFEIKESGALRTEFTLYYDAFEIGFPKNAAENTKCVLPKTPFRTIKAALTISIDAGSQLNKATVVYEGDDVDGMPIAAGFYLHSFGNSNGKNLPCAEQKTLKMNNVIALAEDAISDADVASGRSYLGVIIPAETKIKEDNGLACAALSDKHLLAVSVYQESQPFVYYFGGGWSKWGFETDEDWFNYMKNKAETLQTPLKVSAF